MSGSREWSWSQQCGFISNKGSCLSEVSKVYSPEYDLNMYRGRLAGSCRGHQPLLLALRQLQFWSFTSSWKTLLELLNNLYTFWHGTVGLDGIGDNVRPTGSISLLWKQLKIPIVIFHIRCMIWPSANKYWRYIWKQFPLVFINGNNSYKSQGKVNLNFKILPKKETIIALKQIWTDEHTFRRVLIMIPRGGELSLARLAICKSNN